MAMSLPCVMNTVHNRCNFAIIISMTFVHFCRQSLVRAGLMGLLCAVGMSAALGGLVAARPNNDVEAKLPELCRSGSPCAVVWFSQPGERDYYKSGISIDHNQTGLVDIVIRGSGYSGNRSGPFDISSMHLDRNMNWNYNRNSRIKNVQSSVMYRGRVSGQNQYTSQGGEVRAQLDIGQFDIPVGQSRTVGVGLYSCISTDGGRTLAASENIACGTSDVNVTITRRIPPWTINGQSYVGKQWPGTQNMQKSVRAFPGEQIYWAHDLRNNGPNNATVSVGMDGTGFANNYSGGHSLARNVTGQSGQLFYTVYPSGGTTDRFTSYRIQTSDVGRTLCQRISWSPGIAGDPAWRRSDPACASVHSDFELYPSATIDGKKLATLEGGNIAPSRIDESIHNTGASLDKDRTESEAAAYQFIVRGQHRQQFLGSLSSIFDRGAAVGYPYALGSYSGSDTACTWLRGKQPIDCINEPTFRENKKYLDSHTRLNDTKDINAADAKVGDMICRIVAIKDYNYKHTDGNERRISSPACVTVTKLPWVQIWGGDLRVGNGIGAASGNGDAQIVTLKTTKDGNMYGSWAEYGMMAPQNGGKILSATGGVLSGRRGYGGDYDRSKDSLAFANTTTPAGRWAPPSNVKVPSFGRGVAAGTSIDVGSFAGHNVRTVNGDATIHGTLPGSSTLVVEASGTVTIDGDLKYGATTVDDATKLSQLVIKAKNIVVRHNVKEVNAWLIAQPTGGSGGVISTCDEIRHVGAYFNGLTAETCKEKLTINGTIMARQLQLRRTFGAEKDNLAEAAEVLNQRADVFMWGSRYNKNNDLPITTATTTEAAPRF